jgi:uncharacterized protein
VLGSVHCLAMCGGLAGALGMRARVLGHTPAFSFAHMLTTHLGRIGSYALMGALAGAGGAVLEKFMHWLHLMTLTRVLAGAVLIAIALRIAVRWNAFAGLERLGGKAWSRYLAPLTVQKIATQKNAAKQATEHLPTTIMSRLRGMTQLALLGAAWGWLPCGLVYSLLLFAVFAGSAVQGALIMMAFGVGTLPSMLSTSLLAAQFARVMSLPAVRWLAAAVLALLGITTIIAALSHHGHH